MRKFVAVDMGGTNTKVAFFENDKITAKVSFDSCSESFQSNLNRLVSVCKELANSNDIHLRAFDGMGIALPGIIDTEHNRILSINDKFKDGIGYDIESFIYSELGLRLIIENDSNAAVIGESQLLNLKSEKNIALFMLGTGVGTSVIRNGQILKGANNQAGILGGHLTVAVDGRQCNCGNIGCVEAEASTWALKEIVSESSSESSLKNIKDVKIKDLVEASMYEDPLAVQILNRFIKVWSAGIINLIHGYDPEIVILSGGVFNSKKLILEPILQYVKNHVWCVNGVPKFYISENPDLSGLHGMNILLQRRLNNEKEQL